MKYIDACQRNQKNNKIGTYIRNVNMINIGKSLCAAYKSTVQTDQAMNLLRHI